MSELPDNWIVVPIGSVTVECAQRIPEDDEEFQYIDIASIDRDMKMIVNPQKLLGKDAPSRARKLVRTGDVLVSMTRPNLNAVAQVSSSLDGEIASTGFDVLRAPSLDPRWLYYIVRSQTFVDRMSELVQGALYPAVRSKDVRGFEAPLAPLPEQKRIADKLDAVLARVDACRERLDRVPGILKRFRQAVLAAATSGELTEGWRGENNLDPEWLSVQLKDVARSFSYGTSAKSVPSGKIPVLRMGNIQNGQIDWTNLVYTSDAVEIAKYDLVAGDILFNRTNSPELVGKTALYRGEQEAIFAGYLIRVRCTDSLLPDYLNYCLNSPSGREYCWQVKSDGVSQSNINAKKLAAFVFKLPSAVEQHEIVRRVESLFAYADHLESRYTAARAHVDRLTPSLLAKAFRGELVRQDPNDEPASMLLERISATRSAPGATKSPKKQRRPNAAAPTPPNSPKSEPTDVSEAQLSIFVPEQNQTNGGVIPEENLLAAFRTSVRGERSGLTESELLRGAASRLGFERLGKNIRTVLEDTLPTALHRRVVVLEDDRYVAATPTIARYDDDFLMESLSAIMRSDYEYKPDDIAEMMAGYLGYSAVTEAMRERIDGVVAEGLRVGVLQGKGGWVWRGK